MKSLFETHDQDELVVQSNALIHSRQTFTLLQQRILALSVQQISRDDDPETEYRIRIQDLIDLGTSPDLFNRLEKETRNLAGKVVTRKGTTDEGKRFFEHWSMIKKAEHVEGSGELIIQFHSEIAQQLFDLKGKFGPAVAIEKASCHSSFGARIYEILLDYWQYGEVQFPVKQLKFMLGVDGKYKSFTHFRKYVLQRAQKDVKENTQLRFTWEELKRAKGRGKGRKITHIKFDFSWKANQMDLPMEGVERESDFDIYNLRDRLKKYAKFSQKRINKIMHYLENHPDDRENFKQAYYGAERNIQQGTDERGNTINSDSGYAWDVIEPLIEN